MASGHLRIQYRLWSIWVDGSLNLLFQFDYTLWSRAFDRAQLSELFLLFWLLRQPYTVYYCSTRGVAPYFGVASNLWHFACLGLPSSGSTDVSHHTQLAPGLQSTFEVLFFPREIAIRKLPALL